MITSQYVRPGDRFEGNVPYTVEEVLKVAEPELEDNGTVQVLVRFDQDGGQDIRQFDYGVDIPLTRPNRALAEAIKDHAPR